MRNAALLQNPDSLVDRVTLADSAKVDTHAGTFELHGSRLWIKQHMPIVDAGQRLVDLCLIRVNVASVIVQVANTRVGDVEGAIGYP